MRTHVLASSSAGNATLVTADDGARLLLDAGVRFRDLQAALQHRVTSLDACLITHEHADHAKAARDLLRATVPIYATAGTLDALGLTGHRTHALTPLHPTPVAGWTVVALPALHDAAEPCSFLIGRPPHKILYMTDTGYTEYRFQGLTHILLEANYSDAILTLNAGAGSLPPAHAARVRRNHMSLERAIDLLRANDLTRVQDITLLHLSDTNSNAAEFQRAVERATGKPVTIAAIRAEGDTP